MSDGEGHGKRQHGSNSEAPCGMPQNNTAPTTGGVAHRPQDPTPPTKSDCSEGMPSERDREWVRKEYEDRTRRRNQEKEARKRQSKPKFRTEAADEAEAICAATSDKCVNKKCAQWSAMFDIQVSSTVSRKPECDLLDDIAAELA